MSCCRKKTPAATPVKRGAPWTASKAAPREKTGDRKFPPKSAKDRVPVHQEPGVAWKPRKP